MLTTIVLSAFVSAPPAHMQATADYLATVQIEDARAASCQLPDGLVGGNAKPSVESFYDADAFFASSLGQNRALFSDEQYEEFKVLFRDVLRRRGDSDRHNRSGEVSCKVVAGKNLSSILRVEIPDEDFELDITLHWAKHADGLKIVDASFDGASLAKSYRAQFARILKKEGADGLLGRLRKRAGA